MKNISNLNIKKNYNDCIIEYICKKRFKAISPSMQHQKILLNIAIQLQWYFKDKPYQPIISPYAIEFKNEKEYHKIVPDISILEYYDNPEIACGIINTPIIIVEILSNHSLLNDYTKKMDIYMRFGVAEYWVVSTKNNTVEVFTLHNKLYLEPTIYSEKDILQSAIFEDLYICLNTVFK